jgi:protein-tyrosine phosphatase
MKVLMVCLGNICRSPMAEGILRHLADGAGLDWVVDSAGTSDWHIGSAPDSRAVQACRKNGVDISDQHARQLKQSDFENFDVILTMDDNNLASVIDLAKSHNDMAKVISILEYASIQNEEVPDPYYDNRFEEVFELLWESCSEIIRRV